MSWKQINENHIQRIDERTKTKTDIFLLTKDGVANNTKGYWYVNTKYGVIVRVNNNLLELEGFDTKKECETFISEMKLKYL